MLDLSAEGKLEQAKTLMRALQPMLLQEFFGVSEEEQCVVNAKPFYLSFKGLQTFQYLNPTQAKVLYIDLKRDEGYEVLKKVTSKNSHLC